MTTLREAAQQALKALEQCGLDDTHRSYEFEHAARAALRAALAQQAEPLNLRDPAVRKRLATQWGYVPAAQAEPVEPVAWLQPKTVDAHTRPDLGYETCSKDDYGAFPVYTAPPQRKPVAWRSAEQYSPDVGSWFEYYDEFRSVSHTDGLTPLYTAPPQRQPLTEEEILKAIGWERAEMYMKLATNFPVDEAKQETLKNARAVERAVWEKNHG